MWTDFNFIDVGSGLSHESTLKHQNTFLRKESPITRFYTDSTADR